VNVLVAFDLITSTQLLSADVVAAVDPRDPDRELSLYPAAADRRPPTGEALRILRVVVDPRRRDEQVRYLRDWLASARATRKALLGAALSTVSAAG
jgi:hypothetical protein